MVFAVRLYQGRFTPEAHAADKNALGQSFLLYAIRALLLFCSDTFFGDENKIKGK